MSTALEIPLPDIASHVPAVARGRIDRVGMERIDLPVLLRDPSGRLFTTPAQLDVFVSLDEHEAKGIHMSRLFLAAQEVLSKEELTLATLNGLLSMLVESQRGLSRGAALAIRFDYLVERDSLESGYRGWKRYPVAIRSSIDEGETRHEVDLEVVYSSTCPCSAALSRQLTRERFIERFGGFGSVSSEDVSSWLLSEDGMPATPHSQRSFAEIQLVLEEGMERFEPFQVLDPVESALGTPVQSAVKREDEQAFAELNGSNLMFCEDAVRRIKAVLDEFHSVSDYRIYVRHEESLHPHDAVARITKGVENGLRA